MEPRAQQKHARPKLARAGIVRDVVDEFRRKLPTRWLHARRLACMDFKKQGRRHEGTLLTK